jgi:hypothetical protein
MSSLLLLTGAMKDRALLECFGVFLSTTGVFRRPVFFCFGGLSAPAAPRPQPAIRAPGYPAIPVIWLAPDGPLRLLRVRGHGVARWLAPDGPRPARALPHPCWWPSIGVSRRSTQIGPTANHNFSALARAFDALAPHTIGSRRSTQIGPNTNHQLFARCAAPASHTDALAALAALRT